MQVLYVNIYIYNDEIPLHLQQNMKISQVSLTRKLVFAFLQTSSRKPKRAKITANIHIREEEKYFGEFCNFFSRNTDNFPWISHFSGNGKMNFCFNPCRQHVALIVHAVQPCNFSPLVCSTNPASNRVNGTGNLKFFCSIFKSS